MAEGGSSNPDLNGTAGVENNPHTSGNSLSDFHPPPYRVPTRLSEQIDAETDAILTETTQALDTVSTSEDHFSFLDYGLILTPTLNDSKHPKPKAKSVSNIAHVDNDVTKVPSHTISHPDYTVSQTKFTAAKHGVGTIKPLNYDSFHTAPSSSNSSTITPGGLHENLSRDLSSGFGSLPGTSGTPAPPKQLALPPFLCPNVRPSSEIDSALQEENLRIGKAFIDCNPDHSETHSSQIDKISVVNAGEDTSPAPLPQRTQGWARRSPRNFPNLRQLKLTNLLRKDNLPSHTPAWENMNKNLVNSKTGLTSSPTPAEGVGNEINDSPRSESNNQGDPTLLGNSQPTPGQSSQVISTPPPEPTVSSGYDLSVEAIETPGEMGTLGSLDNSNHPPKLYPSLSPHDNPTNPGDLTTLDILVNGGPDWTTYNETNKWGDTPNSSRSTSPSGPNGGTNRWIYHRPHLHILIPLIRWFISLHLAN